MRGIFVLLSVIAGVFGGAIAIFFFNIAKYFIPLCGGFFFAWFIMALRSDGLIHQLVWRWVLLIGGPLFSFFFLLLPAPTYAQ